MTDPSDDAESPRELYCPFKLPEDEYGDMMFERRLAIEGSSVTSGQGESLRGSTRADTDGWFFFFFFFFYSQPKN